MKEYLTSTFTKLWETIQYSYWVIPSVMAIGSVVMAFGLLHLDRVEGDGLVAELGWVYTGGSDGAREVLSVVAGSMITVAGVVFSITMVALTLASSQFGPRVLRNFMQDRGSQFVLGTFIATFVYSLTILRSIPGGEDGFVPQLSVTASFILALSSLGVLIYFIHHVALSIQGSQIVATIGRELLKSVDDVFPQGDAPEAEPHDAEHPDVGVDSPADGQDAFDEDAFKEDAFVLNGGSTGYLQDIDHNSLVTAARDADVVLRLVAQPGHFVSPYKPVIFIRPAFRCDDELSARLLQTFTLGSERSHTQDVLFAVDQLVEVAVRALSPGINDPFTAIRCLDWLGAALSHCLMRRPARAIVRDEDGDVRLVRSPVRFEDMIDASLQQIQEYGRRSAAVTHHVLVVLRDPARHVETESQRDAVRRHARQVLESGREDLGQAKDREILESRFRDVMRILDGKDQVAIDRAPGSTAA